MSDASELRKVDEARELLELADLVDVFFYSIRSERNEGTAADWDGVAGELDLKINLLREGTRLEVRCVASVFNEEARYRVDAASRFELAEEVEVSDQAMAEFVGKVGLMAVYPYLREAVHQAAAKLRATPPMLGLLTSAQATVCPVAPSVEQPPETGLA